MTRRTVNIPGWDVGYHDEISAHAAVRTAGKDQLFVMTSDDREPRSLDDEATVGLYQLFDDEWDMVGYHDFSSVSDVLKLTDAQLRRIVERD